MRPMEQSLGPAVITVAEGSNQRSLGAISWQVPWWFKTTWAEWGVLTTGRSVSLGGRGLVIDVVPARTNSRADWSRRHRYDRLSF